jgi:putative PIN family toxin of toxin-antitoxin system
MITAILDTNVVVQSLIGKGAAAPARVLDAGYGNQFQLVFSPALLDEWLEVVLVPHIRARHGLSDDELLEFLASLLANARRHLATTSLAVALTRDVTDAKLIALAQESGADYLVTNDRRHLLRLGHYGRTRIVRPAHFLRLLVNP